MAARQRQSQMDPSAFWGPKITWPWRSWLQLLVRQQAWDLWLSLRSSCFTMAGWQCPQHPLHPGRTEPSHLPAPQETAMQVTANAHSSQLFVSCWKGRWTNKLWKVRNTEKFWSKLHSLSPIWAILAAEEWSVPHKSDTTSAWGQMHMVGSYWSFCPWVEEECPTERLSGQ